MITRRKCAFEIQQKDVDSYRAAADELNQNKADVLCVQHEFGIYGGPAGSHLLALLKEVRMPVVTTLHTVLHQPDAAQRQVMEELVRRSDRLVVMARKGAEILRETYGVPDSMVDIIPHGIPDVPFVGSGGIQGPVRRGGQIGAADLRLARPGQRHRTRDPGHARNHPTPPATSSIWCSAPPTRICSPARVKNTAPAWNTSPTDLGVADHVVFFNRFVSADDLREFIGAADIYLTPYLNEAQITSGALAYVFGAGKAVVSTPYWHAAGIARR